jgi:hypothetical protein
MMIGAAIATPMTLRPARRSMPRSDIRQMRLAELAATSATADPARARPASALVPFPATSSPTLTALDALALARATVGALPGLDVVTIQDAGQPEALLTAGDMVLVQRDAPVVDGELCAVRLNGSSQPVFRRVHVEGSRLRLQPENRAFDAEYTTADALSVDGRVVAIVRQHPS